MNSAGQFDDGAMYERFMGRWSRLVAVDFLAWCDFPKRKEWLDVGCGNGAFTEELCRLAKPSRVLGIDPSAGQLEFAKKRKGLANASFDLGDAQSLPVPDASFDVACMALVISFVPSPDKGVAEMKRAVRQGGNVVAYMWDLTANGAPIWPIYEALKSMGISPGMPPQSEISTRAGLERLWMSQQFNDIQTTELRITVSYPDFASFWETSTLPSGPNAERIRSLGPKNLMELEQRMRAAWKPRRDGSIAYEAKANAVRGRVQSVAGDFVTERNKMAQWWADYLDRLRSKRSNVLTMTKR